MDKKNMKYYVHMYSEHQILIPKSIYKFGAPSLRKASQEEPFLLKIGIFPLKFALPSFNFSHFSFHICLFCFFHIYLKI